MTPHDTAVSPEAPRPSMLIASGGTTLAHHLAAEAQRRGFLVAVFPSHGDGEDGGNLNGCRATVATEQDIDLAVEVTLDRLPSLDVAIVAVAAPLQSRLHELTLDAWNERVVAPLRHVFWVARRCIQEFLATGVRGRVVLVIELADSRVAARSDILCESVYSLGRSLAKEYGRRGITCNVVLAPAVAADVPSSAIDATLFLASPEASFVTGERVEISSPS